jgi:hypothetical protein
MNSHRPFIFITSSLLVFPIYLFSQITFERTYGGALDDEGYSVQETNDGGYVVSGYTESFGPGQRSVYLIKTDSLGDTLWTRTYGGPYYDYGYSVQQTSDSGYIIAGATQYVSGGQFDVYLIKTDADGNMLWNQTYEGPYPGGNDAGNSVQCTADGGYIIAGGTEIGSYFDVYLIKTDSLGNILWAQTYGGASSDVGREVQITSDGGYIVVGDSMNLMNHQVYLIKTDSLGDTLWTRTYGGSNFDWGSSVQECPDSGYIIAGTTMSFGAGGGDVWFIKTDSVGNTLWTKTYGGTNYDVGWSTQWTQDGGYVITGGTFSFGAGSADIYLVKTNSLGDTLWTHTYGGTSADWAKCVQQTSDGGYVVVGQTESFGAGGRDVYLVKTDSLGNVTGIEENARRSTPDALGLLEVYPNPFYEKTMIHYALSSKHYAEKNKFEIALSIYDATGRLVKDLSQLLNYQLPNNQIIWSGNDDTGRKLPAGIYFVRLDVGQERVIEKIILAR